MRKRSSRSGTSAVWVLVACLPASTIGAVPTQADLAAADPPTMATPLTLPPPSRAVSVLAGELESSSAAVRAEAARELAGAPRVSEPVWRALNRLAAEDPDRAVRIAADRTRHLLVIRGVRTGIGDTHDEGPRPIRTEPPRLPQAARQRRISGVVRVLVLIDERGKVEDAEIVESIPVLDEAALKCIRKAEFAPATRNGEPVPTYAVAPIGFSTTTRAFVVTRGPTCDTP
jgi:TonB family protein